MSSNHAAPLVTSKTRAGHLVPPLLGADTEFGNFVLGITEPQGTGHLASRLMLDALDGVKAFQFRPQADVSPATSDDGRTGSQAKSSCTSSPSAIGYDVQDWGRKFLRSTGGSAYVDLDHIEMPLPEVRSAREFVAAWHGSIRIAVDAMRKVNQRLRDGLRLQVLANNSDGQGHSYGSHINVLISRKTFNNIFHYRIHYLSYLASYQASSIIFTGQGKVGSENNTPDVDYQIAQRPDFHETVCGIQTTHCRPLVNSRDEPLCGVWRFGDTNNPAAMLARLHVICYDANLCQAACFLKVGVLQLILVMIAADRINQKLLLENPVIDVVRWSHDPSLATRALTMSGRSLTALELQMEFLEEAESFHDQAGFEGLVPEADEVLRLWRRTLESLKRREFDALLGSIDWITKRDLLQRAMAVRPALTWKSPEMKHLDHCYANIDPVEGLYWTCLSSPNVPRIVSDAMIERFAAQPPEDTRAWTRAMLLRLADPDQIESVDWDRITFVTGSDGRGETRQTVDLSNPLTMGRDETGHLFQCGAGLEDILAQLPLCTGPQYRNSVARHATSGEDSSTWCYRI